VLRSASSRWLTVLNHLCSGIALGLFDDFSQPISAAQILFLFLFGAIQMGLPYWLMARGLQSVSPQEAGALTLLEPILVPVWAYLVAREVPGTYTFLGGGLILAALFWRYMPDAFKRQRQSSGQTDGSADEVRISTRELEP
jgi:drug/metabolite transporter (DMT)-like permease